MTVAELYALVSKMLEEGTPREELFQYLDKLAASRTDLAAAVAAVKQILVPIFTQGNVAESFDKALAEVLALIANKYGPVSDAPEIGLA